jgi:ATP-dependent Clp protease protease subunit
MCTIKIQIQERKNNMKKEPSNYVVPTVIENTNRGERAFDIYSRLLKDRIIFLGTPIDDGVANLISAGAVILAGGTPGKRYSLPHARIMLHQPAGGAEGTSKDIEIQAKLITDMRNQINGLLADFTKKDIEQIAVDTDRDFWMTAQEALEYGIVDDVLTQRELADKK